MKSKITWNLFVERLRAYIKNYWWKLIILALILAIDLVSKAIIVPQNQADWKEIVLIKDILVIAPTRNTGAGFSILQGQTWLLISLAFLFIVVLTAFNTTFYTKKSKLYGISTSLIMAGAVGNLVDRILFGYVRDFIYLKFIKFPVFNIADSALTIGIVLLVIYIIFFSNKNNNNDTVSQNLSGGNIDKNQYTDINNKYDENAKYNDEFVTDKSDKNAVGTNNINDNQSQINTGDKNAKDNS